MSKSNQLKPIEIGYGDEKIILYLRMISLAEEEETNRQFADLSDSTEKYQKEFQLIREKLGEFSASMPEKLTREKGEIVKIPLCADKETPTGALLVYFSERTPQNERILRDAYFLFKRQLAPDARFLDFSA